jgi:hypothetical protein
MKAARCAPALCGGKPNDLAAGTTSHRLNFLAARLNGTENCPKMPGNLANVGKNVWESGECRLRNEALVRSRSRNPRENAR